MKTRGLTVVLLLIVGPAAMLVSQSTPPRQAIGETQFFALMNIVATGWNEGSARNAADCFADDAVYMEPPNRQIYLGRSAIYEFFGGSKQPAPAMHMEWRHLAFNSREQVGYGEYTFEGNHRYHGIVTVLVKAGKISKWREYQYRSSATWEQFTGKSRF